MACASLFAKDWTGWLVIHCIVQCDALTNQKGHTAMRLSAVETISQKHVSGPGGALPLGCFTTCKKNQAHQRNMYYTKHTSCFQTAFETSPSDNSRHSKRYPAFDLNYIKRLPK